jgi:hypothetical protein
VNWYSVGLAAASGGLAALVARLIFGRTSDKKRAYVMAVVILFVVFNTLAERFILPRFNAQNAKAEIEAVFNQTPAFATIKEYEPQVYQQLVDTLTNAVGKGYTQQQLIDLLRSQIAALVASRMSHASDDAIITYMQVMLVEMDELQQKGDGRCYKLLFPQVDGGINGQTDFSEETRNRDMLALVEIIKTSNTQKAIPTQSDVMPFVEPILVELRSKFGDDVSVLADPTASNTDQDKVCTITMALYSEILELPPEQAVSTLRWMLGQG